MATQIELDYYFDPLCGWCYASAQGLAALAAEHGAELNMKPTGLFMEPRPVAQIADHAYRNDTNIQELTGQEFTDKYHIGVMRDPKGVFSSGPLTLAFVALQDVDPELGPRFYHAAQIARYVDGADTSKAEVVAGIAADIATAAGHAIAKDVWLDKIQNDTALQNKVQQLADDFTGEMQALGLKCVPHLVVRSDNTQKAIAGQPLYAGGQSLLETLHKIESKLA